MAECDGKTQEDAVLKAVERELAADNQKQHGSVLDVTEDLCGAAEGPRDLSTNPEHIEDYGKF